MVIEFALVADLKVCAFASLAMNSAAAPYAAIANAIAAMSLTRRI
jgi:hypothetical protein